MCGKYEYRPDMKGRKETDLIRVDGTNSEDNRKQMK
jgi:hypothetical protein